MRFPEGPWATLRIKDGDLLIIDVDMNDSTRDVLREWLVKTGRPNVLIVEQPARFAVASTRYGGEHG